MKEKDDGMFDWYMKMYEKNDSLSDLKTTIWISMTLVIGFLSIRGFLPYLTTSEKTAHDGFMFLSVVSGFISIICSIFVIDFLVNFFGASWNSLRDLRLRENGLGKLSFNFETIYDLTLSNRYFYAFCCTFGYIAGIAERYFYVHTLADTASWETAPAYYLTYLKYPVLVFFIGILAVTLTYGALAILQKPLNYFLKNSGVPTRMHGLFHQVSFHVKNKSVLMVFFGVLPSLFLVAYITGSLPADITILLIGKWYAVAVVVFYPVTVVARMLKAKQQTESSKDKPSENSLKTKQIAYNEVSTISISNDMEEEIIEAIREINTIVQEINPYFTLAEIEEAHVLKRITENEVVNLMNHYHKLPEEDRKILKNELLERLHSAKEAAAEIADISRTYHYEEFKKQSDLMDQRYSREKNA